MPINLNDIAILNVWGTDYCRIINGISKSETMGLLGNCRSNQKTGTLLYIIFLYHV